MKRIVLLLLLTLISPAVFAQTTVNASAIERAAKAAHNQKADQVSKLTAQTLADFKAFQKAAFRYQYYDYNFMFQSMDALRESYMQLRGASETAAKSVAPQINEPIAIANGQRSIRLAAYLNMETCTLWQSEQLKFDAFAEALQADLQEGVALPAEFKQTLASFREYVKNSKQLNSNWVLQSMMPVMDVFNKYAKANSPLVPAMARQIQEPMPAGWGGEVVASTFIKDHSCELWQIEDQLEDFRANLLKYTR